MGVTSIPSSQVRDGSFKAIPGVFCNPIAAAQPTGSSYATVDLGTEVAGAYVYATEGVIIKIAGKEVEIPGGVVIFLPWLMQKIEVKQKSTAGHFYVFGGY